VAQLRGPGGISPFFCEDLRPVTGEAADHPLDFGRTFFGKSKSDLCTQRCRQLD
jgi:hypothetical protein